MRIGGMDFQADDLQLLAEALQPYLDEACGLAQWVTPEQYAAMGMAPSADAARKRAGKGLIVSERQGRRLLLRVQQ